MSVTRKSERDIDMLLAKEFSVSSIFTKWFVSKTKFAGTAYAKVEVRVSPSDASGETDLEVRFCDVCGGAFALLIEDKIGARFQDDQLARYHRRAEAAMRQGRYSAYEVVLCSPLNYYNEQPKAKEFPCFISYEDIADHLLASLEASASSDNARKEYRANFLRTAASKAINKWVFVDDPTTNSFWLKAYEIAVQEFPILEMKEPHYTKGTTWIGLRPSCLPTQPKRVSVEIKGKLGCVDLAFANTNAAAFHAKVFSIAGKLRILPTGGAAVLRIKIDAFAISDDLVVEMEKVRRAFVAADELVRFYLANRALLDGAAEQSTPIR